MISVAYDRLYNHLREKIISGEYPGGMKLPSERELCEGYGVSRITIRHALRLLEDQGLIERTPGRGTFVRTNKPRKVPISDMDYVHSVKMSLPNMHRELIDTRKITPPDDIAQNLELLKADSCLLIERLDILDQEPLSYDRGYIPLDFSTSIDDQLLVQVEFLDLWLKKQGLVISYIQSSTEAVRADEVTARRLGMTKGDPVLLTIEIFYTPGGRPAAQFNTHYHGDRFKLVSTAPYKS
jgi:GntR family transcriptional regulator